MAAFEVEVLPTRTVGERVRASARLRSPERRDDELWFELDGADPSTVATTADAYVVASLVFAMAERCDMHVRGAPVSPSLLRNLDEFQQIWSAWFGYSVVDVVAEQEREPDRRSPEPAVVAFSGGVDSAFTTHRHARGSEGRRRVLGAGLMIHGMDIPLPEVDGFARAAERSRRMLASIGLPLVTVTTDAWELRHSRPANYPALGIASAMHLLAGGFGAGLIPATATYADLSLPLNSTPLSDPLLGGGGFEIVHDGAAYNRLEKVRRLVTWDEAVAGLRFCLKDPRRDENCGRCPKCLLTYLAFHVLGVEPRCFETPPSPDVVLAWTRRFTSHPVFLADMRAILAEAEARQLDEPWVRAARRRLRFVAAHRAAAQLAPRAEAVARRVYSRAPKRR